MNTVDFKALPPERQAKKAKDAWTGIAAIGAGLLFGAAGVFLKEKVVVYTGVGLVGLGLALMDFEAVSAAVNMLVTAALRILGRKDTPAP